MAVVRIPDEKRTLTDPGEITRYLAGVGIDYERWESSVEAPADAPSEQILASYAPQIEQLKARGGYVTADVIDVHPQTPGLEAMLAKFNIEHWHDEDEVRYIVAGRGLFHIHPQGAAVISRRASASTRSRVRPRLRLRCDAGLRWDFRAAMALQPFAGLCVW